VHHPAPAHHGVGRPHGVEGLAGALSSGPEEPGMQQRAFGRTGLDVSPVGFGSWPMSGGDRYGAIEDAEAIRAIHRALDVGVNCVDTAPAYGFGHAEEVVGQALR